MPQHIIVVDYDPCWAAKYDAEKDKITAVLKDNCVGIWHIGSTAVQGLAAKPVIDIMAAVKSLKEVDCAANAFQQDGYEYLGEFGIAERRYLRKGGDERTHQLHIFAAEDRQNILRHIAVRNYLRRHEKAREEYAALKKRLAKLYPYDIEGYCDGKDAFVKRMEKQALAEFKAVPGAALLFNQNRK